jgi:hypothetical protein
MWTLALVLLAATPAPDKYYEDETGKFAVTLPADWPKVERERNRAEDGLRRAWSPKPPTVICVSVRYFAHPTPGVQELLDKEVAALKAKSNVEIKMQEDRQTAGHQAYWLVYTGTGIGDSRFGNEQAVTYRHRVGVLKGDTLILLDLMTTADRTAEDTKVFAAMVRSLEIKKK